jgi:alkylated DNA repair dioxygenase AlkB
VTFTFLASTARRGSRIPTEIFSRCPRRDESLAQQIGFFEAPQPKYPEGFKYQPDLLTPGEEGNLLGNIKDLPFKEFEFHGFVGKRRTVSYGWKYSFSEAKLQKSGDVPAFLELPREKAARFAGLDPSDLQMILVTEYSPGSAIGWHKDKNVFGDVIGISLLAPCTFRLRKKNGARWDRVSLIAEPRSVYLLRGESRTVWEHSIPPVDELRYSITFRNLK